MGLTIAPARERSARNARFRHVVCVTPVASGEWRVASGEWRVASGEWRVASGEWRVASKDRKRLPTVFSTITRHSPLATHVERIGKVRNRMSNDRSSTAGEEGELEETLDSQTVALRWIAGLLIAGAAWLLAPILVPFVLAWSFHRALAPGGSARTARAGPDGVEPVLPGPGGGGPGRDRGAARVPGRFDRPAVRPHTSIGWAGCSRPRPSPSAAST